MYVMTKDFLPKLRYLELLTEFPNGITSKDAVNVIESKHEVSQEAASMAMKRLVRQGLARRRRIFDGATFEYGYFINKKGLARMEWFQFREERSVPEIISDLEDEIDRLEMKKSAMI